jgi:hypothetical protein
VSGDCPYPPGSGDSSRTLRNSLYKYISAAFKKIITQLKHKIPATLIFKRNEPHHFGGAGAVKRCGSGSDDSGSKGDVQDG